MMVFKKQKNIKYDEPRHHVHIDQHEKTYDTNFKSSIVETTEGTLYTEENADIRHTL